MAHSFLLQGLNLQILHEMITQSMESSEEMETLLNIY